LRSHPSFCRRTTPGFDRVVTRFPGRAAPSAEQRAGEELLGDPPGSPGCRWPVEHRGPVGVESMPGGQDIDALVAAFTAAKPAGIAVPPLNRILPLP
jgi:hypothetical protein